MIGYEDEPEHSAEICICEIFGRDVAAEGAMVVGMGLHPFGDPRISEEFGAERVAIYAREFHVYAVEWTPEHVAFSIDGEHVKRVGQSPSQPMQLMLSLYEFPEDDAWDRTITEEPTRRSLWWTTFGDTGGSQARLVASCRSMHPTAQKTCARKLRGFEGH